MEPSHQKLPMEAMEFDVTHGVGIDDPAQPLVLYWNGKRAFDEYWRSMRAPFWFLAVLLTLYAAVMIGSYFFCGAPFAFVVLGLAAVLAFGMGCGGYVLYIRSKRASIEIDFRGTFISAVAHEDSTHSLEQCW
jgi:hypothetical protein